MYRDSFETLHFVEVLVLEGVALGLIAMTAVGVWVFKLQATLPCRKVLIATGVVIVASQSR